MSADSESNRTSAIIDEYTQMKMIKTNGVYQWGFDLTDFNPNGKKKFQNLMDDFGMEFVSDEMRAFTWKNQAGDLKLFTANNPVTGLCIGESNKSDVETGYLAYVGVECNSPNLLSTFFFARSESMRLSSRKKAACGGISKD